MGISFQCDACGKQYKVADELAGKRGKCKNCGAVIQVPRIETPADEPPDLSALAEIERTGVAAPEPAYTAPMRHNTSAPTIRYETPPQYAPPAPRYIGAAAKPRKSSGANPFEALIHDWLPIGLILVGYGLPFLVALIGAIRSPAPLIGLIIIFSGLALLVFVVVPITVVGLKVAAKYMEFELVASPGFRVMAAFAAGPLVFFLFEELGAVSLAANSASAGLATLIGWFFLAVAMGLVASLFLLWLLFQVRFNQAVVTWLFAALANVVGSIVAFVLFFVIMLVVARAKSGIDEAMGNKPGIEGSPSSDAVTVGRPMPMPQSGMPNGAIPGVPDTASMDLQRKRMKTESNLTAIRLLIFDYSKSHSGFYPKTVSDLQSGGGPDCLHSPFSASPDSSGDYAIEHTEYQNPFAVFKANCVVAYDASQLASDDRVAALTSTGLVTEYPKSAFDDVLKNGRDQVAAARAESGRPHVINTSPLPGAGPIVTDAAQPGAADQTNIAPQPVAPAAPAAPVEPTGWTATVDALAKPLQFKEDFHWFTPTSFRANDLLYPTTAGTAVAAGLDFENGSNGASDVHEAWDLRPVARIGRIVGPLPLKHAVLSADGQFIAGTTSGGAGQATVFEMWSFKTGRKAQTFAAPPVQGNLEPIPLGFNGPDSLITVGDGLMLWDFKSGVLAKQIDLKTPRNSADQYALSATGKLLAILDSKDRIDLYDLEAGKYLGYTQPDRGDNRFAPARFRNNGRDIAFSPDGTELALYLPVVDPQVVVFSVANGKQLADLKVRMPAGGMNMNRKQAAISWLPDGTGWLLDGSQIVDRQTGIILCPVTPQQINNAEEYGPRMVLSDKTVIMSFKSFSNQVAIGTYPLPADVIAKTRAVVRGGPTTAPATKPPAGAAPTGATPPTETAPPAGDALTPDGAQN